METSILIKGKNFNVTDITTDQYGYAGCETCDYGSSYTSEVTIFIVKDDRPGWVIMKSSKMYSAPKISMSDLIIYFCKNYDKFENKTLEEFITEVTRALFDDTYVENVDVARSGSAAEVLIKEDKK